MRKICFVSNEIHPTRPGGAGSLIYNLAHTLLANKDEVILLLDIPKSSFQQFDTVDRLQMPNHENYRSYHVDSLCSRIPCRQEDFISRYLWESYRYDFACRQVYQLEKPDLIEFVDYCGPAYYALCAKVSRLSYRNARIVVRIHGSIEEIDRHAGGKKIDFDRYTIYALEQSALHLAETVLYPGRFLIEHGAQDRSRWFGDAVHSPPPIVSYPKRAEIQSDANIVLFVGRLYPVKAVDVLVDSAIRILETQPDTDLEFYLVGEDSSEVPVEGPRSYQDYLLQKIPHRFRNRFVFTGQLSHKDLAAMLERVKFAVFPSYYETFGFAANELKLADIPLIVADIPAFRERFISEKDALFFDGSVSHLTEQITRLDRDKSLLLAMSSLGDSQNLFAVQSYPTIPTQSWMVSAPPEKRLEMLVCILKSDQDSDREALQRTVGCFNSITDIGVHLILFTETGDRDPGSTAWFMGKKYRCSDQDYQPISFVDVRTFGAILILKAGDLLDPKFIRTGSEILSCQPEISYINCWKWIQSGSATWLQTHPIEIMPELAAFEFQSVFNRCIMRTVENSLLVDLFDRRAEVLGEVDYLWQLDPERGCGIEIAEALLWIQAEELSGYSRNALSYLILKNTSVDRSAHLARYLAMSVSVTPQKLLPLQQFWAEKSGMEKISGWDDSDSAFIVRLNWRDRLLHKLRNGGYFAEKLLSVLQRLRSIRILK